MGNTPSEPGQPTPPNEEPEGGPCQSCKPGSVSIEWNCPQCGGTGIDPTESGEAESREA